ncbi:MAG: hypothetical protein GWP91_15780, partial [Rhodobacterales bacterium]|nr:hypothetical protein [Rhodobacterales bacterium]
MRLISTLTLLTLAACGWITETSSTDVVVRSESATYDKVYTKDIVSSPYHIDKRYPSMVGPSGFDHATLLNREHPELLWIVGYESKVVDAETHEEMSQEWMCHANLDLEPEEYFKVFPTAPSMSGRLFTLSQGQQRIDLPMGFGIPVPSTMNLSLATQVLNLNADEADLDVRHKVTIRFVRDSDVKGNMMPVYQTAVEGFKALADAKYYGISEDDMDDDVDYGPGCSVGQAAIAGDVDADGLGQKFSAHWLVETGEEENRTNVTRFLNLPYDTKAHYIATHLHPFAESLELRDLTTDQTVYLARAENSKGRVGLERVDFYSSAEGIQFYRGHEYELVSRYNN